MGLFSHFPGFGRKARDPEVLQAIDRAISAVDPLLKQLSGYPDNFYAPVARALSYARQLADNIPGPVVIDREAYAKDPLVHAIFPTVDFVKEALCSSKSMRDYHSACPAAKEVYALMGMRRCEKTVLGMELSGEMIRREVPQEIVYFTSHTLDYPALSEKEAREGVAWGCFDSLAAKVQQRIAQRKQQKQSQLEQKNLLMSRLHTAKSAERTALEKELSRTLGDLQNTICSLDLRTYLDDFNAVMLHPEEHLRLEPTSMVLDSMGIRHDGEAAGEGQAIMFNDLIGYDRRKWTVTMVYCGHVQPEPYTAQLEAASRKLAL